MEYIDADRLRAEINRRIKIHKELIEKPEMSDLKLELQMVDDSLQGITSFIDSLQQEASDVDLEKAARHVYESWMGGTMDDVRRDMVELGKVLNARKEDK